MKLKISHILIAFFVVSYVGSIFCNFYLLRRIDHDYSDLIDHSVPALRQLNSITASAAYAIHQTYPPLFNEEAVNRSGALESARIALADEMKFRADFVNSGGIGVLATEVEELQAAGIEFSRIGHEVVELYHVNHFADASSLREKQMRPAFERYLAVTKQLALKVSRVGEQANVQLTENTKRNSAAVLGIGGWPLVAVFGVILSVLLLGAIASILMPEQP